MQIPKKRFSLTRIFPVPKPRRPAVILFARSTNYPAVAYRKKSTDTLFRHNLCFVWGMKHLRTPFIAAFTIGLLALIIAFLVGLRYPAEPTDYLWYDSLQQLGELGRAKYRQSHRYGEYAHRAEHDSLYNIATMFRALAYADNVQCNNCRKAIESLGGRFHTPVLLPSEREHTHEHLHSALKDKYYLHNGPTTPCINRAMKDGNRYVARLITWCDASDIKQILILQREIDNISRVEHHAPHEYRICPTCGAIYDDGLASCYCPHCMTESKRFVIFK